jgi:hypothetical protein
MLATFLFKKKKIIKTLLPYTYIIPKSGSSGNLKRKRETLVTFSSIKKKIKKKYFPLLHGSTYKILKSRSYIRLATYKIEKEKR